MTVEEWKRKNPPIQRKPITNGDRIRAMADDDLAEWIATAIAKHYDIQAVVPNMDSVLWLDWLKQEVDDD